MHYFDITVLSITAIFFILGIKRGLVKEIFRLAAVLGGFFAALMFYKKVCLYADFITLPSATKTALVFLLTYFAFAVVILVLGWVVRKIIHLAMLGFIDRLLGGVLGIVKSGIIIWILMLCVSAIPNSNIYKMISKTQTFIFFHSIPLSLDTLPPACLLQKIPSASAFKQPLEKVKIARGRIEDFREKVDSAKTFADSLQVRLTRIKD